MAAAAGRRRNSGKQPQGEDEWDEPPYSPTSVDDCYNDALLARMQLERFRNSKET
jgi:hypothetical protein